MIVFTPKPHQETVSTIDNIFLRLCISYREINVVTTTFVFLIPRCSESVEGFGDYNGAMFYIKLDNRQDYHQI